MAEELRRQMEEEERRKIREEEDRMMAEEEFIRRHRETNRMGRHDSGPERTYSTSSVADSESESDGKKRPRTEKESPSKTKKKKPDTGDEDLGADEDEFGQDPVENVGLGLDLLVEWLRQPTINKLVTKPQQRKFFGIVKRMREEVDRCKEERIREEIKVEQRKMVVEEVRAVVRDELKRTQVVQPTTEGNTSFASVVKMKETPKVPKVTGMKGPVLPAPQLVIIKSEDKESKEVEAALKRIVKPAAIGLKVKRLMSVRNGVIVEAEDNVGAENLLKHAGLKDAGLKVGKPVRKNPVIMVYDVGKDLKDEDVKQEVFARNFDGGEISLEDFKKEFEVRHRYNDARSGGKKCHLVVECSVRVRNWMRGRERVFIEWQSCRVKDYVDVPRCFKCQRYGHVAKHCGHEKPDCSFCAGEHDYKDCPHKTKKEKVRCINCDRDGRTDNKHEAGWRGCPSFERAAKRLSERIDYGA